MNPEGMKAREAGRDEPRLARLLRNHRDYLVNKAMMFSEGSEMVRQIDEMIGLALQSPTGGEAVTARRYATARKMLRQQIDRNRTATDDEVDVYLDQYAERYGITTPPRVAGGVSDAAGATYYFDHEESGIVVDAPADLSAEGDAERAELCIGGKPRFRTMADGATFDDYCDQLALGMLTPVDQMALDNMIHDRLTATPSDEGGVRVPRAELERLRNIIKCRIGEAWPNGDAEDALRYSLEWVEQMLATAQRSDGPAQGQGEEPERFISCRCVNADQRRLCLDKYFCSVIEPQTAALQRERGEEKGDG